mmetsp:Transcript_26183/g.54659  ORF Transcript_26183/g.54659 Transcript_26183/m.54659 type:complete len:80 (-) Transcript_26183:4892-5131(-)
MSDIVKIFSIDNFPVFHPNKLVFPRSTFRMIRAHGCFVDDCRGIEGVLVALTADGVLQMRILDIWTHFSPLSVCHPPAS